MVIILYIGDYIAHTKSLTAQMILAAIDIGSNAIRLQIVKVYKAKKLVSFKRLQFLRFPLRLGHDVFEDGKISKSTLQKFTKLMATFKNLIDLYEVDGYTAVATSAMREAKNGTSVRDHIENTTGINIEIISGSREAKILYKAIIPFLKKSTYIHIDVGGGSTELNVFKGKKLIKSKSFRIGSVRKLHKAKRTETFKSMKSWMDETGLMNESNITAIGTGGNINKLFKIANKEKGNQLPFAQLKALRAYVDEYNIAERISLLKMNPDRADVIIPACEIYIKVMSFAKSDHIMVPKVGLKDGVIYEIYEKLSNNDSSKVEVLEED